MKISHIYTDGACAGNPGPGGWGVVIYFTNNSVHELGGGEAQTTNNRMEMQAAIAALEFFQHHPQTDPILLYTDSEYLKNGITKWVKGWKRKNWKTSQNKPVLNQDLWEILDQLNSNLVEWRYVRGHSGNEGNERCDTIARQFSQGHLPSLHQQVGIPTQIIAKPQQSVTISSILPNQDGDSKAGFSDTGVTDIPPSLALQSVETLNLTLPEIAMTDSTAASSTAADLNDHIPNEVRLAQLRSLLETLRLADEVANQGYLITSSELADLMDVNASAVTSRGDHWVWRNWVVSRVRREGNQILWQLERVD